MPEAIIYKYMKKYFRDIMITDIIYDKYYSLYQRFYHKKTGNNYTTLKRQFRGPKLKITLWHFFTPSINTKC